jgi:hypothetical protein
MEFGTNLFYTIREFVPKFRNLISVMKGMERCAPTVTFLFSTYIGILVISRQCELSVTISTERPPLVGEVSVNFSG